MYGISAGGTGLAVTATLCVLGIPKSGDDFVIKMIALENSCYNSLNELEKDTIATYNAYSKGYNKTRGNRK